MAGKRFGALGISLLLCAGVLAAGTAEAAGAPRCTKRGTPRNDVLVGTNHRDVICGFGGDDRIIARGGNDDIYAGGSGRYGNTINPGPGDDIIHGGSGPDMIDCAGQAPNCAHFGDGNDRAYLGDGKDGALMGAGNDLVHAGSGQDVIWGGPGKDELYTDGGSHETLYGGPGNDYLEGHGPYVTLHGDAGHDVMFAITPNVLGGSGAAGGDGNDVAMLLDGTRDLFQAGRDPSGGGAIPRTPCRFTVTGKTVSVSCPLFQGLGTITIDSEGKIKYSNKYIEFAKRLKSIWNGEGLGKDTCFCDERVPGIPEILTDVII